VRGRHAAIVRNDDPARRPVSSLRACYRETSPARSVARTVERTQSGRGERIVGPKVRESSRADKRHLRVGVSRAGFATSP